MRKKTQPNTPKLMWKPKPIKLSPKALEMINKHNEKIAKNKFKDFSIPEMPLSIDGEISLKQAKLVMDDGLTVDSNSLPINQYDFNGLSKINNEIISTGFLGLAENAILTQSGIMQNIINSYAGCATKEWVDIKCNNNSNSNSKTKKIKAIEHKMKELELQDKFRQIAEQIITFGSSFLYPQFEGDESTEGGDEMLTPLYKEKIKKGSLLDFKVIEPLYCYPLNYNASNPLSDNFYKPKNWNLLGRTVDESRLLHFVFNDVPNLLKPVYLFGGMPLLQLCLDNVYGYENVRHNIVGVVGRYNINVFKTNMAALLSDDSEFSDSVIGRLKLANYIRDNYSIFALDNNPEAPEEWQQFTMSLAGFSDILSQNAELVCATAQIPAIIMFGTSPKGFNSNGETELRTWYDRVRAFQINRLLPQLQKAFQYIQLDLFGEIDEDLVIEFKPLWTPSELEQSQIQLNKQQKNSGYVSDGTLLRSEIRESILEDAHSGYNTLLSEEEYLAQVEEQMDNEETQF